MWACGCSKTRDSMVGPTPRRCRILCACRGKKERKKIEANMVDGIVSFLASAITGCASRCPRIVSVCSRTVWMLLERLRMLA